MARLTNSDRERILKGLKPNFYREVEEVKKTMASLINEFLRKNIPDEVFVFMRKYPNLIYSSKTFYVSLKHGSTYIEVIEYPSNHIRDLLYTALDKDKTGKMSNAFDLLKLKAEEARILEKKVSCILANISTEKKLKDEFPEAYKIYINYDEEAGEDSQNMCDNIENVRAELSKLNKK